MAWVPLLFKWGRRVASSVFIMAFFRAGFRRQDPFPDTRLAFRACRAGPGIRPPRLRRLTVLFLAMLTTHPAAIAALEAAASRDEFAAATAAARDAGATPEAATPGPFEATWDSLQNYRTPGWFRDAKFGIWAHWGPQCQPERGDWYGRHMYLSGTPPPWAGDANSYHRGHYGHPSEFGFKDVIAAWRGERWEPDKLVALYKRAGARYFMAMANHHDNLDLWDSRYQPWNSVLVGPRKNLIDGWARAARREGLPFGVSIHASHAWHWYETARGADPEGPFAGRPYDGALTAADGAGKWWDGLDPQDLYVQNHPPSHAGWEWQVSPPPDGAADPRLPDAAYLTKFYNRTLDLINRYDPDAVYFDDTVLPFHPISDVGRRIVAHYYNRSLAVRGRLDVVVNGKKLDEIQRRSLVFDIERGKSPEILPRPWQTCTCLGNWHYDRRLYERAGYKSATEVIHLLADVVSKNGNLLLSVPLRGDGSLDDLEIAILAGVGAWLEVNGEAIYATRPWAVFGEGPALEDAAVHLGTGEVVEKKVRPLGAEDVRYTRSKDGRALYAIVLGWPADGRLTLRSLATRPEGRHAGGVGAVTLLGSAAEIAVRRDEAGLHLGLPPVRPATAAAAHVFRVGLLP